MLLVNKINKLRHNFWFLWFLILTVVFLIHCLTLTISPTIWMDEIQIIDYGRTIFHPQTNWSINWSIPLERPVLCLSYLGTSLQAFAYEITHSPVGPRLISLIGSTVAATSCLAYLLSLKTSKWVAFCLSLAYLLDPIFVSSYRGARVDCWAISLCFISCWLVRHQINNLQSDQNPPKQLFFVVGVLMTLMAFIWPTALFLFPLILLELYEIFGNKQEKSKDWSKIKVKLLAFCLGVCITSAIVIIPVWQEVITALNDLSRASRSDSLALNLSDKLRSDFSLFKTALSISPFLLIGGVTSALVVRDKKITCTVLLILTIVLLSRPYGMRIVYLIPYLILAISYLFKPRSSIIVKSKYHIFKVSFLIILLTWSLLISLGYRTVIALSQVEGRNSILIEKLAQQSIGYGNYNVLIPYEFYYAGRTLNWNMYTPFGDYTPQQWQKFMLTIDYAILGEDADVKRIQNSGLHFSKKLSYPIAKEQNKFFFGGKPFGTYKLYAR